jgi:hypothetical protein
VRQDGWHSDDYCRLLHNDGTFPEGSRLTGTPDKE